MDILEKHYCEYINSSNNSIIRNLSSLTSNIEDRNIFFNFIAKYYENKIDVIISPNIYGSILAEKMNLPFIFIQQRTTYDPETIFQYYEHNSNFYCFEIHSHLIQKLPKGNLSRILLLDDILYDGKSILAMISLLQKLNCNVSFIMCLIEILGLEGRQKFVDYDFISFYKVPYDLPLSIYTQFDNKNHKFLNIKSLELLYNHCDYTKLSSSFPDISKKILDIEHQKKEIDMYLKSHENSPIKYIHSPAKNDNRVILFYHYDVESIAKNIVDSYPNNFRLGRINWNYFPDKWYNISFDADINNKNIVFIGSLYDPTKFLENAMMSIIFPRQHVKSFTFVIPYFAPATMERVHKEGILATAEPVAKLLTSSLQNTKNGACTLKIFDIHALPVHFYFDVTCITKQLTAIPLIKNIIKKNMLTVCFPDDGAAKRFKHFFEEFPMVICSKQRIDNDRKIIISDKYNFNNEFHFDHVIIIDDLVQSGGTLHECRLALQNNGFKKVSCFVTHAVFPNECFTDFMENGTKHGFEHFYVTNTNPIVTQKLNKPPFNVLKIDNILADDIMVDLDIKKSNKYCPLEVFVTSTDKFILDAVNLAIGKINNDNKFYPINIYGYNVPNDVNPQPFSINEINDGCLNRLNHLMEINKGYQSSKPIKHKLYIAIESGFVWDTCRENCIGYDIAIINVNYLGKKTCETSEKIYIDNQDLKLVEESFLKPTITIGSKLEQKYGYPNGQWHEFYSNLNKTKQISDAIENILYKVT